MYSKEQKLKAVLLYIKYGCRASATVRELGYPCRHLIREWYLEYREKGEFVDKKLPKYSTSKFYSMDQMRKAGLPETEITVTIKQNLSWH